MNYFTITFLGLLGVTLILHTVFFAKKLTLPTKITEGFQVPLLAAAALSMLIVYFPDSFRSSTLLTLSFVLFSASRILLQFDKKGFYLSSQLFFIAGICVLNILYGAIILLYHVQIWTIIFILMLILAVYILIITLLKKQKPLFYLTSFTPVALVSIFVYEGIFTLLTYRDLASSLLLAGTILFFGFIVLYIINKAKLKLKIERPLFNFWLLVSMALISASSILMLR